MKLGLTKQQRRLLDFIEEYINQHQYSPNYDEMKEAMGVGSKNGIFHLVKALIERGWIKNIPNRSRSISLV